MVQVSTIDDDQLRKEERSSKLLFFFGFFFSFLWLFSYLRYRRSNSPNAQRYATWSLRAFIMHIVVALLFLTFMIFTKYSIFNFGTKFPNEKDFAHAIYESPIKNALNYLIENPPIPFHPRVPRGIIENGDVVRIH